MDVIGDEGGADARHIEDMAQPPPLGRRQEAPVVEIGVAVGNDAARDAGREALHGGHRIGIEGHDHGRSGIGREDRCHGLFELAVAGEIALQFDHERHRAGDRREKLGERRHAVAAEPEIERLQRREAEAVDAAAAIEDAVDRVVMEDHHRAIGRELQVDLDREAMFHRRADGRERVLDAARARIVIAAMGDRTRGQPGGGHREPPCQAISMIASTSTATPKGRPPTPTAERAWRPFSSKISTMKSEAPLTTLG